MAARRTRRTTGSDVSRTTAARAAAVAEQLRYECSILLELYVSRGGGAACFPLVTICQQEPVGVQNWREKCVCVCVCVCISVREGKK